MIFALHASCVRRHRGCSARNASSVLRPSLDGAYRCVALAMLTSYLHRKLAGRRTMRTRAVKKVNSLGHWRPWEVFATLARLDHGLEPRGLRATDPPLIVPPSEPGACGQDAPPFSPVMRQRGIRSLNRSPQTTWEAISERPTGR